MELDDLIGEVVIYQPVRGQVNPAIILRAYPDGRADMVLFAFAGSGTYIVGEVPFGTKGSIGRWWFKKVPEKLEAIFSFLKPKEPEATEQKEDLFVDDDDAAKVPDKSAPSQPVRKPAIKGSRL